MNEFDDELRRIFGDDRLAVTPSADAVGRIVRGARRRRTVRMVASTAGSIGVVAALALGSMAVTGQFSAGPTYEPEPAESPDVLPPELTPDPVTLPVPGASPSGAPVGDPSGDPTGAATGEPSGEVSGDPTGSSSGTGDLGGEQPENVPDPVDVSALPLFDPAAPFDGVQVRMTLAELQQVPGVQITRLRADDLDRPQLCYGEFRTPQTHGYISLRGAIGDPPADLLSAYEVSRVVADVPVRTPAGVGVGSTGPELLAAYPGAVFDPGVASIGIPGLDGVVSMWNFHLDGDVVTSISHEGLHNCGENPVPAPPPAQADFDVPGSDVFGPVRLGMTLAELRATAGVEITEWIGERSRPYCYGEFRVGDVTGLVSVLRDMSTGELPAPATSEADFVVSSLGTTAAGTVTPAGVGVGSTLEQVASAQPGFTTDDPMSAIPSAPATQGVRWTFETWDAGVVQRLGLDAGHSCIG